MLGLGRNRARPERSLLCLSIIWAAPSEADSPASPVGSWGRPQGVIPSPMILQAARSGTAFPGQPLLLHLLIKHLPVGLG